MPPLGLPLPFPSNKGAKPNSWAFWGPTYKPHPFPAPVRTGPACMP